MTKETIKDTSDKVKDFQTVESYLEDYLYHNWEFILKIILFYKLYGMHRIPFTKSYDIPRDRN